MSSYKAEKKDKKRKFHINKKWVGVFLIALSCLAFLFLFTKISLGIQNFILGTFGYFSYVLFVVLIMFGVTLINQKKYVLSKKYATFLYLTIIFFICIVHLAIVGDKGALTYAQYLNLNYVKQGIGGIVLGLFTGAILYLTGFAWSFVIYSACFIISFALFIDVLLHNRKERRADAPVKINIKPTRTFKTEESEVFDKEFENKQKKEEEIRKKLGLVGRGDLSFEQKSKAEIKQKLEGEALKKMILTPPEVDIRFFGKQEPNAKMSQETVAQTFADLDNEVVSGDTFQEQSFDDKDTNPIEEIRPDTVVSAVDNMLKDAMRENGVEPRQETFDTYKEEEDFAPSHEKKEKRFIDIDGDEDSKKTEIVKPYNYTKPPISLLTTQSTDMSELDDERTAKTVILENTLEQFGVPAKVQDSIVGPTVSKYELSMPVGVPVKKILGLSNDIALALEARGEIRIEAPVPGRNVVGIEIPNNKQATISLKDIVTSNEFLTAKNPLSFAVGKNIEGKVIVGSLSKMPHLLIAGTTGSGKSVMLNTIILSLLYKYSPEEVRLLLVDPKLVEFMPYQGMPHLIIPKVISEIPKASNALSWAVCEMERRFNLFASTRVKDIGEYNATKEIVLGKKKKMPYIVIIIDEFSDFIMQGKKEVEDKIVRLGQKARAAGIHLILAMQRPTNEFITGGIKANFASKIAFKVANRIESEVIIGKSGAEKLLGKGDMLYAPIEFSSMPKRVQGCFMTTQEIGDVVKFVTDNNEECFDQEIIDEINNPKKVPGVAGGSGEGVDPMLPKALKIGIDCSQISASLLQRKLSLGWPRAAKIIDQLADMGYVSRSDGTAKPRSIYITLEEFHEKFGDEEI